MYNSFFFKWNYRMRGSTKVQVQVHAITRTVDVNIYVCLFVHNIRNQPWASQMRGEFTSWLGLLCTQGYAPTLDTTLLFVAHWKTVHDGSIWMTPRYIKRAWYSIGTQWYNIMFNVFQIIPVSIATALQQDPYMLFYELKESEYNKSCIMIINHII